MSPTKALTFLAVLFTLAGCGQQQGVCIEKDPEDCVGSQKNTCEKQGFRWEAFKNESAFDKVQDTCAALGYSQPSSQSSFVKPGAR